MNDENTDDHHEPVPVNEVMSKVMARFESNGATDRIVRNHLERMDWEAGQADRDRQNRDRERERIWENILRSAGSMYSNCHLGTWKFYGDADEQAKQRSVIAQMEELCKNMQSHIEEGGNVILYGPPGTGKDFLGSCILHQAVGLFTSAIYLSGMDFFGSCLGVIKSKQETENDIIKQYTSDKVLLISDPAPLKGESSPYSYRCLYRLIDHRYRNQRGTWITINAATAAEAGLSAPVFDRLRQRAITAFCNWGSFRPADKPQWKAKFSDMPSKG